MVWDKYEKLWIYMKARGEAFLDQEAAFPNFTDLKFYKRDEFFDAAFN